MLQETLDYDPITGIFRWKIDRANKKAGDIAGNIGPNGYRTIMVSRRVYYAHHLALLFAGMLLAERPKGLHVDHINGDKTDNRIENLRVVPASINSLNRKGPNKNSKSGILGVSWDQRKRKWTATIQLNGKTLHLGRFANLEAAVKARADAHARYCWGQ